MHIAALDPVQVGRIGIVAAAALLVWVGAWEPVDQVSVVGIAGLVIGGWPIYREAFANLIARRMTMELSMTIAIVAAAAISEFFTAFVITLFVLVAEMLEGLTVARGRTAIRDLSTSCRARRRSAAMGRARDDPGRRDPPRRSGPGRSRRSRASRRDRDVGPVASRPGPHHRRVDARLSRSPAPRSTPARSASPAPSRSWSSGWAAIRAMAGSLRPWKPPNARGRRCSVSPTNWRDISSTSRLGPRL